MRNNSKKGAFAEDLATIYLKRRGFTVTERNFRAKHGEIDIVSYETKLFKESSLHFFEVKSSFCKNLKNYENCSFDPQENMSKKKFKHLYSAVQEYLKTRNLKTKDYKLSLIIVKYSPEEKTARFKIIRLI